MNRQQQAEALIDPQGVLEQLLTQFEISLFDRFLNGSGSEMHDVWTQGQAVKQLRQYIQNEAGEILDE